MIIDFKKANIYLVVLFGLLLGWCSTAHSDPCIYKCDYPESCGGIGCDYICMPIYQEGWCLPFPVPPLNIIRYFPYAFQYDCDGDPCFCRPSDVGGAVSYRTMAECEKIHGGVTVFCPEDYISCMSTDDFPPPDCPKGEACCIGGGGPGGGGPGSGGGGGGGGSGGGGGGFGGFILSIINLAPHSPAPELELRYNPSYKIDRGLGEGWSHTYMLTLEENSATGNVTIRGETGFGWLYKTKGDGTYESAPYDRSQLRKVGNTFISTLKNGTEYIYNQQGKLVSIVDPNNNALMLNYNAAGFLQTVADNFGRMLQFTYANDHLQTVTDPNTNQYRFVYQAAQDGAFNLMYIAYPDTTQKQFEYYDPNFQHNLTRVVDNNGHTMARYAYDVQGRIISSSGADDSDVVDMDYAPATELFTDDFQNGLSLQWITTGTVELVNTPDQQVYGDQAVRLHPGSMEYSGEARSAEVLKATFDLWVGNANSKDFSVKIYDSTEADDEHGVWIWFRASGKVETEFMSDGTTYYAPLVSSLSKNTWHKIEIKADARDKHKYFDIWIDCEYLQTFPFKRSAQTLDTIAIQASTLGNDVYLDNVWLEEITTDGSTLVKTDSQGNREVISITAGNEFGGESWSFEKTGKVEGGCGSCGPTNTQTDFDTKWNIRRTIDANDVITEMTYDERGNMLTKTEAKGTPLERTTTYTYHPVFNKVASITEAGVDTAGQNKVTINIYDEETANLLSKTVQGYSRGAILYLCYNLSI